MNLTFSLHIPYLSLFRIAITTAAMASTGPSTYTRMTGGCTTFLATQMLQHLQPPLTPNSSILDNACGPGTVSAAIKALYPDAKITATDLNPAMVAEVQQLIASSNWKNVFTAVLDARDLHGLENSSFSHVFMNLGLPAPGERKESVKAVREVFRVLKTGGVALFSTWSDRVWLNAFYATARIIRPHEEPQTSMALPPEQLRGSWLVGVLEDAGFGNNVELRPCVTYSSAASLDELVENMTLAKRMFWAGYSDGELERAKGVFKEELRKLRTFEEREGDVRVGMKAWIGVGWKTGDEGEVPV